MAFIALSSVLKENIKTVRPKGVSPVPFIVKNVRPIKQNAQPASIPMLLTPVESAPVPEPTQLCYLTVCAILLLTPTHVPLNRLSKPPTEPA